MDPSAESVWEVIRLFDFVPEDEFFWAYSSALEDLCGDFPPEASRRTWVRNELAAKYVPQVLAEHKSVLRAKYQVYTAPRRWRGILYDSRSQGPKFSAHDIADVLLDQNRRVIHFPSDKTHRCVLILNSARKAHLDRVSEDKHSEPLTARSIIFLHGCWRRAACKLAQATWRPIDTSEEPYDAMTAAAEFLLPSGQNMAVIAPVARQWDEDEPTRLVKYLTRLRTHLLDNKYAFQIHSPRIGKGKWLDAKPF